jgi:hypothetical protein
MPKLTIRYLIDGAQVEEEEFEGPSEEDLRTLIGASKFGVSECVSGLAYSHDGLASFENLSKTMASRSAAIDMQDVEQELRERGKKKD